MSTLDSTAAGFGANEWMVEEMRDAWLADPSSVTPQWRALFEGADGAAGTAADGAPESTDAEVAASGPQTTDPAAGGTAASGSSAPASSSALRPPPRRPSTAIQDVTRSDLPPAPPSDAAPPTSPYAQRTARHHTSSPEDDAGQDNDSRMKGAAARTAKNMEASLSIPTATSARAIPAKVLIENRAVINGHLLHTHGGKISFTHLIGWAVVEALAEMPSMNVSYTTDASGRPALHAPAHVAFGLAIDVPAPGGERRLLVPSIKKADLMDAAGFVAAYEDLVAKAREGRLEVDDFRGTTVTLTNPGMIGTLHSVPRLMPGQGLIVGVGSMAYPAAFAGASEKTLARHGVGKVVTLTSTYDHRVIQGAASGEFLRLIERKLLGLDGFWGRIFESLRIPHEPVAWARDATYDPDLETGKPARVAELIHAFRQRGHLAADTDPLTYRLRRHPDLDLSAYGLSLWDLDRTFPTGGLGGTERATLREILARLRRAYCRTAGIEYMHIQDPAQRIWWQERLEGEWMAVTPAERRRILTKLEQAEAFETFLQTKYVGQKRFSLEGGESLIVLLDRLLDSAAHDGLDEVVIGMTHRGRLNVLTNIAGKSYGQVFDEFDGTSVIEGAGTGDVKYHLGTEGVFTGTDGVSTRVSLAANPSHLETVDGVVEGIVRAKQDRIGLGEKGYTVMPVLVHGDAAFAGQGVVYETLNMSQLPAYRTGGTVHIVVNNQIGFTTGAASARSMGGSRLSSTLRSAWGRGARGVSCAAALARRWRRSPASPNLAAISRRGRRARSPRRWMPRRESVSMTAPASSRAAREVRQARAELIGQGARKAAVSPGATMMPRRAARTAPRMESAMPTWHSTPIPWVTASTMASARDSSPPAQAAGPRAPDRARPGRMTEGSARTVLRASMTPSKARASRSGCGGMMARPGHRDRARRRRMPTPTPAARAAGEAATTPRPPMTATGPVAGSGRSSPEPSWAREGSRLWRVRATTGQSGTHAARRRGAAGTAGPSRCSTG